MVECGAPANMRWQSVSLRLRVTPSAIPGKLPATRSNVNVSSVRPPMNTTSMPSRVAAVDRTPVMAGWSRLCVGMSVSFRLVGSHPAAGLPW